jgi:Cdc25 family phosphatase
LGSLKIAIPQHQAVSLTVESLIHYRKEITSSTSLRVIDVRSSDFAGGHVAGAINMPFETFDTEVNKLVADVESQRADRVVFYCMYSQERGPACAQSFLSAWEKLHKTKPPEVYYLTGGMTAWINHFVVADSVSEKKTVDASSSAPVSASASASASATTTTPRKPLAVVDASLRLTDPTEVNAFDHKMWVVVPLVTDANESRPRIVYATDLEAQQQGAKSK